ncbi:T9SS type A sorting domain-containing protein [Lacinutrix sp. C3R15]|uniref:T9SS type A sorting domain-containing protein n=1 Tax=Flavobacteriaceae TaxID=49546 RepID=UPI001C086563|nr:MULTISPECIES: T9SS type A sorting domain-containing protein [Flavobacteriaceae]MBU2939285.1 T9SS type A sorting domain-containing protein [Lacinutrix sp. C3R15]MDO6622600.1 T9SS type A sorting domain-containing protein [Oceanihabitans sp. 1_MG-2023]
MKTRLLLILLLIGSATFAQTYVNINAVGNNDGTSWTDAYTSLQTALSNSSIGEEIWIASGTYKPHATNRTVYFIINKNDLKIYGGFAGTELQLTDRVFGTNETILSGDLQDNDVNTATFTSNYSNSTRNTDNSYHIINILSSGNNLLLDGLTISDAHNNRSSSERGGAILKEKTISDLTIKNCIIKNNVGRNDNAGLHAEYDMNNANSGARGTLVIENTKFISNMSRWGSGIYSFVRANSNVDISIVNCLFDKNITADLNTTDTGLSGSASWFRALEAHAGLNLDLVNNTYINNIDLGTGNSLNNLNRSTVGISEEITSTDITFNANVSNCIFWNNKTTDNNITRAISDLHLEPANLNIYNSLDELGFNDFSITSKTNTSFKYPYFTDAVNEDYTLLPGSPAIGTGDNTKVPVGITKDLANNARIQQTTVDMGAFESAYTSSIIENIAFVNINATGNNDGSSWTDAYTNLQDAILSTESGSEIWIAEGTYNPDASDRTVYYEINKANIIIYGGFAGTEAQISERVVGANETILSGDLQNNDVNTADFVSNYANATRNTDNSYHLINIGQSGINLELNGLTISDVHNNLSSTEKGGAILKNVNVPKLTIRNCIIKNNVSRNDNAGLFAEFRLFNTNNGPNGALIIENSVFANNMSRFGSAIYSYLWFNTTVDVVVANSLFENNIAADLSSSLKGRSGSASWFKVIQNNSELNINLVNNTYAKNIDTGTDQGLTTTLKGVVVITKSSGVVSDIFSEASNCVFWDNETTGGTTSRAFSYQNEVQPNSLNIYNSIDALDFNYGMVSSKTNTSTTNPLFTDAANNDFTLQMGSPAIDSGDNSKIQAGIMTDLLGKDRIFNTTVDMGAYEYGSTLDIEDVETKNDFVIYPNPTSNMVYIKMTQDLFKAEIFNIQGQKVLESSNKKIEVTNLANGMYLLQIEDTAGNQNTKRFIKN